MIKGVQFAGVASGIKPEGLDLGLVYFPEGVRVLALYTRNKVKAAHILYNRKIGQGPVKALLANSGCANACTGGVGVDDLGRIAGELSRALHVEQKEILFASTGVIGRRMPADTIIEAIPAVLQNLGKTHLESFARAIMTTDTYHKVATATFQGDREYTVTGVAKGAGMINPLFATMLSFIFTDYPISPGKIRNAFAKSGRETFERISVDGECSTNDTVMLFAPDGDEDPSCLDLFKGALHEVMEELALLVVGDGEGATRVIHVTVQGAKKKEYAEKIARRIAISPLTKTAFFGCDPNWGRIIAAAGDAHVPLAPEKVEIIIQGRRLVKGGIEVPFDEKELKALMNRKEVELVVDLHDGRASYDMYTTDLTYDYVKINASYRS